MLLHTPAFRTIHSHFHLFTAGVRVNPSLILALGRQGDIIRDRVLLRYSQFGSSMTVTETIRCRGHPNVLSLHPTTFEITKEVHLTCKGDCIIAVGADKGAADLSPGFRSALSRDDAVLLTRLTCGGISVVVTSFGSDGLVLDHPCDMVWRRSRYVCGRTVGIETDLVARTLPRELIDCLKSGRELLVEMTVTSRDYREESAGP
jgi:hypothetical protein